MSARRARRIGLRMASASILVGLLLPFGSGLAEGSAQAAAQGALLGAKPKPKVTAPRSSWKQARYEQFVKPALPAGCTAYTGTYAAGANSWTSKAVKISKGALKLSLTRQTLNGKSYAAGGLACLGWGQKYGRYDIRAQVPVGKGIGSTFALWPTNVKQGAWTGLELLAPGPDSAYLTNGYSTSFDTAKVDGLYAGKYHDYGIEWSPNQVRMTVDGQQIYYSTRSFNGPRWLGILVSSGDALTGLPDVTTPLPAQLLIDSITTYSYTGLPPKPQPVTTPSASLSGTPDGTSTTTAAPSTGPRPTGTGASAGALAAQNASAGRPALAGGVWPWLLGGSLIAVAAIAGLNYAGHRRRSDHRPSGRRSDR